MGGIFGVVHEQGRLASERSLAALASSLKHRGPAGIRMTTIDNAGLGHCLLQTLPASHVDQQPLRCARINSSITADARIDNRRELKTALKIPPNEPVSDAALILRAYEKWDTACVDYLMGDFVFAIWDERKQSLLLARDHMGCKPLYYARWGDTLVFASSAQAIACSGVLPARVNEGRVADYLVEELEGIDHSVTFFENVYRLPPASFATYSNGRLQLHQYWQIQPAENPVVKSDEDWLEAFVECYSTAIACRLPEQGPSASMLSGGLDSSTICALARETLARERRDPLHTYSAVANKGESCRETDAIRSVLSTGGMQSTVIAVEDLPLFAEQLQAGLSQMEDPFDGEWTLLTTMFCSAASHGHRSILTGVDGDLAMGLPDNYLPGLMYNGAWSRLWQEAQGLSKNYHDGRRTAPSLLLQALKSYLAPDSARAWYRRLTTARHSGNLMREACMSPAFASRVDLSARTRRYRQSLDATRYGSGFQAWQQHAIQVPYLVAALERYERLGSYFGIEPRHPLLDIRLLHFFSALPWSQKVRNGWSKYLLRKIAANKLTAEVAWRKDTDSLGWAFSQHWARTAEYGSGSRHCKHLRIIDPCLQGDGCNNVVNREMMARESQAGLPHHWANLCQWLQRVDSMIP